jgi:hypothetical protein
VLVLVLVLEASLGFLVALGTGGSPPRLLATAAAATAATAAVGISLIALGLVVVLFVLLLPPFLLLPLPTIEAPPDSPLPEAMGGKWLA